MNRRPWLICFGGLLLIIVVVGGIFLWPWDQGPIRFENVEKIQAGMTPAEVIALLGCERGVHTSGPVYVKQPRPDGSLGYEELPIHDERAIAGWTDHENDETWFWIGSRGCVVVTFDREMKVTRTALHRGRRSPPSGWWMYLERSFGIDS